MFGMMPFTMLLGAMFIRGRGNALLYDHLVHTAYSRRLFLSLACQSCVGPGHANTGWHHVARVCSLHDALSSGELKTHVLARSDQDNLDELCRRLYLSHRHNLHFNVVVGHEFPRCH